MSHPLFGFKEQSSVEMQTQGFHTALHRVGQFKHLVDYYKNVSGLKDKVLPEALQRRFILSENYLLMFSTCRVLSSSNQVF